MVTICLCQRENVCNLNAKGYEKPTNNLNNKIGMQKLAGYSFVFLHINYTMCSRQVGWG